MSPVRKFGFQHITGEPLTLPLDKVAILDRQLILRNRLSGAVVLIKLRELTHEHAYGPSVRDDVVHRQKQFGFIFRKPEQCRSEEWTGSKIKRAVGDLWK